MAANIQENSMKELSKKSNEELLFQLKDSKEELFNLRFQKATGQLTNSARLNNVRQGIARMYTILRERDLGIISEPVIEEKKTKKTAVKKATSKSEKSDTKETEE